MKILITALIPCFLLVPLLRAQSAAPLSLMPMPASVQPGTGRLMITQSFSVAITGEKDPVLHREVERFVRDLSRQTGMPLSAAPNDPSSAILVVHADHAAPDVLQLGDDESYRLDVTSSNVKITAPTALGAMHGMQTLLQLIEITPDGFSAPAVTIEDRPRFQWRGLLIDVSRHFMPLAVLRRNLDAMAAVKMNVLHVHLSDNQGFRVESKKFTRLQEMGSDGLYYTQDEIRDLIAYARDRGIRIVPEFDMPGHSTAWFVGYPDLASAAGPYQIERRWGIFDPAMDPTREDTYKFLDGFIAEMAALFPDAYFHIGGDEVNGKQWDANPKIQQYMRSHGIRNNQALQAYFNQSVQAIVTRHGKIMEGWDEILSPDLPKDIVIQSWRGQKSLAEAAKQGYRGLLSAGYYLDWMYPAYRHYQVDPMSDAAANLTPEQKERILGGEACMWAEFVTPENIDSRIWPRTAAIAERLWSPQEVRDQNSMYARSERVAERLEWLGVTHDSAYPAMLARMAGTDDIAALRVLGDVLEPVKEYTRESTAEAAHLAQTSADPLNRMVDAVPPESATARKFSQRVDALIAGNFRDLAAAAEVRARLTAWRDNPLRLQPMLQRSFLLKELAPLSQELASLGGAGLQALDFIEKGQHAPGGWVSQQLAMIEQAKKPRADLLIMVAPAVEKLVEAAR